MENKQFCMGIFQLLLVCLFFIQCNENKSVPPKAKKVVLDKTLVNFSTIHKKKLSEYNFFRGNLANLNPEHRVIPYDLNTPLFTNYAFKKRFIYLPKGAQMTYNKETVFDFDEGTIIIKVFYYPENFNNPDGEKRIIETRLLIKENEVWIPLNYVWNESQDDAYLNYLGKKTEVSWRDENGVNRKINYNVPNNNLCKNCHLNGKEITPIGPTAAQLNGKYKLLSEQYNQLIYFAKQDYIKRLPDEDIIPRFPVWNDPKTGGVEQRSKAYLDINCAHCHQPQGSAKNSGLDLRYSQTNLRKRGVYKPPVAAGKGSGNLEYGIVPGHPEHSILLYRMNTINPGVMMPEIGRSTIHTEGVALITDYIKSLSSMSKNDLNR